MKAVLITAAIFAAIVCCCLGAQGAGSQGYIPARFALIQGSLSVSNIVNSGGTSHNVQQCILKLDTRTGDVWVLQLAVNGSGDPTVRSAVWAKVNDSGAFYPNGAPMPMSGD